MIAEPHSTSSASCTMPINPYGSLLMVFYTKWIRKTHSAKQTRKTVRKNPKESCLFRLGDSEGCWHSSSFLRLSFSLWSPSLFLSQKHLQAWLFLPTRYSPSLAYKAQKRIALLLTSSKPNRTVTWGVCRFSRHDRQSKRWTMRQYQQISCFTSNFRIKLIDLLQ